MRQTKYLSKPGYQKYSEANKTPVERTVPNSLLLFVFLQSAWLPDGQIAAIARSGGYALATRNTKDFEDCEVELINPLKTS